MRLTDFFSATSKRTTHLIGKLVATFAMMAILAVNSSGLIAQQHDKIIPYLDEDTLYVGWLDIPSLDVQATGKLLKELEIPVPPQQLSEAEEFVSNLSKTGLSRIYFLSTINEVLTGNVTVVAVGGDGEQVRKLLAPGFELRQMSWKIEDGVLLAATESRFAEISAKPASPFRDLKSLLIANTGSNGIVAVAPDKLKETIKTLMLIGGNKEGPEVAALEALMSLESVSLQTKIAPADVKLAVEYDDIKNAAKALKAFPESVRGKLVAAIMNLKPAVDGNKVTFEMKEEKEAAAAIKSVLLASGMKSSADASQSMNNMKQIALSFHNFESAFRKMPPQALTDDKGTKLLSWRVMILPFIEQNDLYQQFHLDEPWDSEHNIKLVEKMPAVFASTRVPTKPGYTTYQTPLMEDSFFGRPGKPAGFSDVLDGTSVTIWLVQTTEEKAVIWTKPDDIVIRTETDMQGLSKKEPGILTGYIDGSVRVAKPNMPWEEFRKRLTINGGEVVNGN